ncbi:DUF4124 domain-containing protein [Thermomonas sp. XSG]|jgi:hypothetical protein|uniref:DUF4124 domain-containing protein n=1 Tax=Thermomonas sp. XSG TaxID=2771436 RepID=UPI00086A5ABE|nr:DUF4124 domain-containing protein [Thermomonas sp. XSG]ODU52334.1 MAG: hypothetical protein ABS98_04225 [Xanthomonadaceae bacterium SCN 69-48]QNU14985.1 DUF4124 domain-containing protein [Thermomonas sp. XSG]
MRLVLVLVLLLCAPLALPAQDTVFYKCTDAKGNVSMQNGAPCASGMKQEIRRIGAVKTMPVPARKPQVEAPAPPPQYGDFVLVSGPSMQRTPAPEAAGLPAPPPLYQCRTWDGETYFGESAEPPPRCAPLQVTGLDGRAQVGMASACEMKQDSCAAVPDAQLCATWYRRLDEADFKLRYADDGTRRERQAALDAIDAKIKASRCATSVPADPAVP